MVSQIKYFVIIILPMITDDILFPIIYSVMPNFKPQCTTWCKLPLSVVDHTNLIKVIWMPQLLYFLHNSPCWLPLEYFKTINGIFCECIKKRRTRRIKLGVLQHPRDSGGLAVSNQWLYFIATQLQHLAGWELCAHSSTSFNIFRWLLDGANP